MEKINWFFIIFCVLIPFGSVIGMGITLIVDHVKAKRRHKRDHREIDEWWKMTVK